MHKVTEPVRYPSRQRLPVSYAGMDLSPIVIFLRIILLNSWRGPSIERVSAGFLR